MFKKKIFFLIGKVQGLLPFCPNLHCGSHSCNTLVCDCPSLRFWQFSLLFPCVEPVVSGSLPSFLNLHLCFGEMHPSVTFKKMYEKVKLLRCLYCWKYLSSTLTLGWLFGWSGHRIPRWNIFPSKFKGSHYNYLASGGCWKVLCLLVFILPC